LVLEKKHGEDTRLTQPNLGNKGYLFDIAQRIGRNFIGNLILHDFCIQIRRLEYSILLNNNSKKYGKIRKEPENCSVSF